MIKKYRSTQKASCRPRLRPHGHTINAFISCIDQLALNHDPDGYPILRSVSGPAIMTINPIRDSHFGSVPDPNRDFDLDTASCSDYGHAFEFLLPVAFVFAISIPLRFTVPI
ncbi:hypothetical protein EVAR_89551_1 [Eumeta japonica]|uniref:Uncharacterized protein n=1 Tax=Eumeta variegata TaxID=151549 RepID=A0A4C1Z9L8_EUMVA|nr:hypothetical protein EVAR_89551_1 [Eumeta japonica]